MSNVTVKRTAECAPNPVFLDGVEIGTVEWTGCFYTKRGRSQGWWFITGSRDIKYKTMKAAAEALAKSIG